MENHTYPLNVGIIYPGNINRIFPTTEIRLLRPLEQLRKQNCINYFHLGDQYRFEKDYLRQMNIDLVIIQRHAVQHENIVSLLDGLRQIHIPIIYELDDDLLSVPKSVDSDGTYGNTKQSVSHLLKQANLVTVSTPELKKRFSTVSDNIVVVPNRLDDDLWFRSSLELADKSGEIKVLYMGSRTHDADLALVDEAARRIISRYHNVKFYTIHGTVKQFDWLEVVPVSRHHNYYTRFVPWYLQKAKAFDFAIAPLEVTSFTAAKSYIKYLDYSAVPLAGIYSNCGQYPEIVKYGENGLLVENSTAAWVEAIEQMIQNPEQRQQMAKRAYETAYQHRWSLYIDEYFQLLWDTSQKHRLRMAIGPQKPLH